MRRPLKSTLFPYTTLFRSQVRQGEAGAILAPSGPAANWARVSRASWKYRACPSAMKQFRARKRGSPARSEEHTSELQSPDKLVCRLLLEKKTINTFAFAAE